MQKQTTNQILADSFKELILTQPIEKITIKEITDKAGVIRPTFYNHFQDKYELLEWIIKEDLITPIIPLIEGGFIKESITLIFSNVEKEKEFYTHAAKLEGQNSFSSIIELLIQELLLDYFIRQKGENAYYLGWLPSSAVAEYYAHSICFLTLKWILSGMPISPAELAVICEKVFESNIDDILNDMK